MTVHVKDSHTFKVACIHGLKAAIIILNEWEVPSFIHIANHYSISFISKYPIKTSFSNAYQRSSEWNKQRRVYSGRASSSCEVGHDSVPGAVFIATPPSS